MALQSLKYLPPGPLQDQFANLHSGNMKMKCLDYISAQAVFTE